jgi:hypothetical protein
MNDAPAGQARPPTHEALWPTDLFRQGLGWVIVVRFKAKGQRVQASRPAAAAAQAGVFLVDVFCLGVKLAVWEDCDMEDYRRRIREHYQSRFPMVSVEPCCARKLVERAVQYAQSLGLAPHPDYKKAARVFGGVQAAQCAQLFTFGCKGKPFYRRGPSSPRRSVRRSQGETEARALTIERHLERRCGPGNYDYEVPLGQAHDITRALGL